MSNPVQKPQSVREQLSVWWLAGLSLNEVLSMPLTKQAKIEARALYSKRAVQQSKQLNWSK